MHSTGVSLSQRAMRREQRAMKHAVGVLVFLPSQTKFSSSGPRKIVKICGWFHGGVPRSGEVVFFLHLFNLANSQDHPGTSCHPSTGGELSAFFYFCHSCLCPPTEFINSVGPGSGCPCSGRGSGASVPAGQWTTAYAGVTT